MSNGPYTEKEQEMLDNLLDKSMSLINEAFKNGIPTDNGSIRTLSEAIERTDNMINKRADARIKYNESTTDNALKETIAATIRQSLEDKNNNIRENLDEEIVLKEGDLEVPIFAPGEAEIEIKELSISEFNLGEDKNDDE